ncbi:hypothetical protein [Pseudomonas fluorescens]|uniref:hypothetical protein n=1 Tax=Pseudomonas fluorescens TaxID=294 RepID=UPI0016567E5B|nr:hypothetical protein [Pseudomonas fluorescens]MBC8787662.1 hypothetical protein [Pseudomonas fluorescens]
MSEVKRWYIGVYGGEAQARVCAPHPQEFIRDSEGQIFVIAEQFDACEARNFALQQRLTAADELADQLKRLLRDLIGRAEIYPSCWEFDQDTDGVELANRIVAALKPAEVARCTNCGRATVEQCDDAGCGFLGAPTPIPPIDPKADRSSA